MAAACGLLGGRDESEMELAWTGWCDFSAEGEFLPSNNANWHDLSNHLHHFRAPTFSSGISKDSGLSSPRKS
jgi:hypothetical protein